MRTERDEGMRLRLLLTLLMMLQAQPCPRAMQGKAKGGGGRVLSEKGNLEGVVALVTLW